MKEKVSVGIIMGSDSDYEMMKPCESILKEFGVGYETKVISAHRTPDILSKYAKGARGRGLKVIIAAAGGAAHLPGVTAAFTTLPVIGVPVKTSSLSGLDSLLSIVQMPSGIPVATVAINGSKNAGLLAIQILALSDESLSSKIKAYKKQLAEESKRKNLNLK